MPTKTTPLTAAGSCCHIELTDTVEDYLKAIFAITSLGEPASTSGIAARIGVTSPSVSAMLHRLRDSGLVEQTTWGHVALTDHGESHARHVVRRHRLLETFLHRVLGVSWDEIHVEAEVLEHHISGRLENLIDAALGFPDRDPHGDPIPSLLGKHEEHGETPLARCAQGDVFLVQRIYDTDSAALRHLGDLDIRPGVSMEVEGRASELAPMRVRVGDESHSLSCSVVNLIHGHIESSAAAS